MPGLYAELKEKTLLRRLAVSGRVQHIDFVCRAHGYADASHRPHVGGSLCREIAQSVESIGREGIQAAALRLRGDRQRAAFGQTTGLLHR